MSQETIRQHYVPKFYLKQFANEKGNLHILNILDKRIEKAKSPKSICCEEYYYAIETGEKDDISQEIEKLFEKVENIISDKYFIILNKIRSEKHLTYEDKDILSLFSSLQFVRSPYMRNKAYRIAEEFHKPILDLVLNRDETFNDLKDSMSVEEFDKFKEYARNGGVTMKFNNQAHYMFLKYLDFFHNLFFHKKKLTVYLSKCDYSFVTTDIAIIEDIPETKNLYGGGVFDANYFLPLAPDIFLKLIPDKSRNVYKIQRKSIYNRILISELNIDISRRANKYVYSNGENMLSLICKEII